MIGFFAFSEIPSMNTVLGAGIILSALAILGYMEMRQNQ